MAREGQTILAFGILAGMAYFFRNQLKALFSSAKAGQSTAGAPSGNAPTKNPVGADGGTVRGIADALGRISSGIMGATQWGIAQPTFGGGSVTYKDISGGKSGGVTIYYPPPTDSPENEFPGRD